MDFAVLRDDTLEMTEDNIYHNSENGLFSWWNGRQTSNFQRSKYLLLEQASKIVSSFILPREGIFLVEKSEISEDAFHDTHYEGNTSLQCLESRP